MYVLYVNTVYCARFRSMKHCLCLSGKREMRVSLYLCVDSVKLIFKSTKRCLAVGVLLIVPSFAKIVQLVRKKHVFSFQRRESPLWSFECYCFISDHCSVHLAHCDADVIHRCVLHSNWTINTLSHKETSF